MRILHVSASSTLSGANRYAFDIAAGQHDLGHEAYVAMPRKPGLAFDFAQETVRKAPLGSPRALSFFEAIRRLQPDIVHCHGAASSKWMRFCPFRPPTMASLHIHYKPRAQAHLDGLHVLADWQLPATSEFRGVVRKVNNWTSSLEAVDTGRVAEARAQAGAGPDDVLIGFVGRLDPVKGVDLLIEAFLRLDLPNVRLAIVGKGSEQAALEAMAKDEPRIRFMGYTPSPQDWYAAVDVLAMPSHHEPFALVALEAMSLGTPILASDLEGFQEIFHDQPDRRFAGGNIEALAAALRREAVDKSTGTIRRLSYDMSRFDRCNGVAAVTDFYSEVIEFKTGRRPD